MADIQSSLNNHNLVPFLRLPFELRLRIYHYLLGDEFVHLRYQKYSTEKYFKIINRFQHNLCQYPLSETDIYERLKAGNLPDPSIRPRIRGGGAKSFEEVQQYMLERRGLSFPLRHDMCKTTLIDGKVDDKVLPQPCVDARKHRLQLGILQTCRQLYEEASTVLWTTNTFSFEDWSCFKAFINPRKVPPRTQLSKLHFDTHDDDPPRLPWASLQNNYFQKRIPGVHTIHVTVSYKGQSEVLKMPMVSPLFNMSRLDLKHVTCVVYHRSGYDSWFNTDPLLIEGRRQSA